LIDQIYRHFLESSGVFTDSRTSVDRGVFFALSGPNFNGNKFAKVALEGGAKIAIIDDPDFKRDERFILVEDALETLQALARLHRSNFKGPVIGLTGSNGKTTTKELIAEVLKTKFQIIATEGNLNNHIGVPLTLLRIKESTEIAVIEMGANHIGEIELLCSIAQPSHGLITNIGKAHLEGFGSYEGVLRGKSELYDFLLKSDGQVFINSLDPVLRNMGRRFDKPFYYPQKGDYFHCEMISSNPYLCIKTDIGKEINTQLIGEYNFANVATALCLGKYFEVPARVAEEAVSKYVPEMNRSQVVKKGTNMIILDAYNANPESMSVALKNLGKMEAKSKVVILGDMLELGADEIIEHERLGEAVNQINPDKVYFCGQLVKHSAGLVAGSDYYKTKDELTKHLKTQTINDSLILIKASRGIGLESLIDLF